MKNRVNEIHHSRKQISQEVAVVCYTLPIFRQFYISISKKRNCYHPAWEKSQKKQMSSMGGGGSDAGWLDPWARVKETLDTFKWWGAPTITTKNSKAKF